MSDFYGCLESTSFRVRNRKAWLADPVVIKSREIHPSSFEENDGWWVFGWYDQYPSPVFLLGAVQRHIRPGDVCQVVVSGNEKLRYIGGGVWFVTSQGVAYFEGTTEWNEKLTPKALRADARRFLAEVERITKVTTKRRRRKDG